MVFAIERPIDLPLTLKMAGKARESWKKSVMWEAI